MMRFRLRAILAATMFGATALSATASETAIQRDVRIMEGVLSELLATHEGKRYRSHDDPEVTGLYFEGYGVLFLASVPAVQVHVRGDQSTPTRDVLSKEIRSQLQVFYDSYARNIAGLSDSDRVTVRVDAPEMRGPFSRAFDVSKIPTPDPGSEPDSVIVEVKRYGTRQGDVHARLAEAMERIKEAEHEIQVRVGGHAVMGFHGEHVPLLEASARKRDLEGASTKINFRSLTSDDAADRTVRIMAGILDDGLDHGRRGGTEGFYQPGLGAIFVMDHHPGRREMLWVGGADVDFHFDDDSDEADSTEGFTRELVRLVGEYGSTLKPVKGNESIAVRVDFGRWGRRKGRPSGLMVRVSREDVSSFARGKLALDALVEAAEVDEIE